jgi:branched-subunit amino acid ABC-type transport system permease component
MVMDSQGMASVVSNFRQGDFIAIGAVYVYLAASAIFYHVKPARLPSLVIPAKAGIHTAFQSPQNI